MKIKPIHITYLFLLLMLGSCETFHPSENIPAYIHIDKINLQTDYATEGSNSSKITDAWIYIDQQPVGVYELPATFPVIASNGAHQIMVFAGIKVDGIAATRLKYTYYHADEDTINLQQGSTTQMTPSVKYASWTKFDWKEDFEGAGVSLITNTNSDTTLQITHDPNLVFEGNNSGIAYVDDQHPYFEAKSSTAFSLPHDGTPLFLELNYKCDNEFAVGVYKNGSGSPLNALNINPTTGWNKIYVNLTSVVNTNPSTSYTIYIAMYKNSNTPVSTLQLDNIKLIE